jgi:hypothetical protein
MVFSAYHVYWRLHISVVVSTAGFSISQEKRNIEMFIESQLLLSLRVLHILRK